MTMTKFASKYDDGYAQLVQQLRKFVKGTKDSANVTKMLEVAMTHGQSCRPALSFRKC